MSFYSANTEVNHHLDVIRAERLLENSLQQLYLTQTATLRSVKSIHGMTLGQIDLVEAELRKRGIDPSHL